jgi:hypothetical protein
VTEEIGKKLVTVYPIPDLSGKIRGEIRKMGKVLLFYSNSRKKKK